MASGTRLQQCSKPLPPKHNVNPIHIVPDPLRAASILYPQAIRCHLLCNAGGRPAGSLQEGCGKGSSQPRTFCTSVWPQGLSQQAANAFQLSLLQGQLPGNMSKRQPQQAQQQHPGLVQQQLAAGEPSALSALKQSQDQQELQNQQHQQMGQALGLLGGLESMRSLGRATLSKLGSLPSGFTVGSGLSSLGHHSTANPFAAATGQASQPQPIPIPMWDGGPAALPPAPSGPAHSPSPDDPLDKQASVNQRLSRLAACRTPDADGQQGSPVSAGNEGGSEEAGSKVGAVLLGIPPTRCCMLAAAHS